MTFDPNTTGLINENIFGLPNRYSESAMALIPVPWEVTTSYGSGTSMGPASILASSFQLDLCDSNYGEFYKKGISTLETPTVFHNLSNQLKPLAIKVRTNRETGIKLSKEDSQSINSINKASEDLNDWVYKKSIKIINDNKIPGVLGGDHSSPYGLLKAISENYSEYSILHIDAHMDLRKSYQDYQHSHASIMYNVHQNLHPSKIIQIGIRDFCPEEKHYSDTHQNIYSFYDSQLNFRLHQGELWGHLCDEVLALLGPNVYVSLDIDGLSPDLCPNTGTPVPGGLSFPQLTTLLLKLNQSEKKIIGFDLCEVCPERDTLDGWDGNVGARVLFQLCGASLT